VDRGVLVDLADPMTALKGVLAAAGLAAAGTVIWPAFGRVGPPAIPPAVPYTLPAPAAPAGDVRRGYRLYAEHCATCHGLAAEGTPDGMRLQGIGAAAVDFVLRTGRMPLTDPQQPMYRRPSNWTPQQITDVAAYVSSLGPGGPPIPTVNPAAGSLSQGRDIYAKNCAPCHGVVGQGATVGEGAEAPPLFPAGELDIAEAVRIGPLPMPRFDPDIITQYDLDSLVKYVVWLRHPPDRGGFNMGHVGPVAEGFIAWAVGLGSLVLIIRAIGTTE
jgi:ubiquinol-cytochrome c reductase cytochrome c subunit